MRAIVSNLTAAMLLIHALVGCCRHREHDCVHQNAGDEYATLVAACCHHSHSACHGQNETPPCPDKCGFECQGFCTYLPPQKTLLDAPHSIVSLDFLPVDPTLADSYLASAKVLLKHTSSCAALGPPLRLHLLHQIILV